MQKKLDIIIEFRRLKFIYQNTKELRMKKVACQIEFIWHLHPLLASVKYLNNLICIEVWSIVLDLNTTLNINFILSFCVVLNRRNKVIFTCIPNIYS